MRLKSLALVAALIALSACSSSHRVTYSGHEESTEGVPGFVGGKRVSPNVKLGQSYSVDGETYVPRYQPDYTEEGLASWYGPGFHGGKTANGETFDKSELTAAHRTLPLPSIVRVTLVSTGKSAIVRVNDRGPFAKGRIIDLSRGAAEKIGLIGVGVGKVKVEYLPAESQRFADLLADGRDPKSIDVNEEVLAYVGQHPATPANAPVDPFQLAQQDNAAPAAPMAPAAQRSDDASWWDHVMPVANARADEPAAPAPPAAVDAPAPAVPASSPDINQASGSATESVSSSDLPGSAAPAASTSPIIVPAQLKPGPAVVANPSTAPPRVLPAAPAAAVAATGPPAFLQLGAFVNRANAESLVNKVRDLGPASISPGVIPNGQTVYRVRMGPYPSPQLVSITLKRLAERGIDAKPVRDP